MRAGADHLRKRLSAAPTWHIRAPLLQDYRTCFVLSLLQDHNEPALDGITFDLVNYADLRSFQLQLNRQFINYRLPLRDSRGMGRGEHAWPHCWAPSALIVDHVPSRQGQSCSLGAGRCVSRQGGMF